MGFFKRLFSGGSHRRGSSKDLAAEYDPTVEPEPLQFAGKELQLKMTHLPAGRFWMGGVDGKCGKALVTISNPFAIGIYPVTQGEWLKVMDNNPSYHSRTGRGSGKVQNIPDADLELFPVEQVSWFDVKEFFARLNSAAVGSGWTYRLPTSEEWEYALRSPVPSPVESTDCQLHCSFSFYFKRPSNDISITEANFTSNLGSSSLKRPSKVGSYGPNGVGIYDLHGNVSEWTDTWAGQPGDPGARVVCREGSWASSEFALKANSTALCRAERGIHSTDTGFRIVRVRSIT